MAVTASFLCHYYKIVVYNCQIILWTGSLNIGEEILVLCIVSVLECHHVSCQGNIVFIAKNTV